MTPETAIVEKRVDIRALAQLARVDISDAEVATLEQEIPSILAFVETIQEVDVSGVVLDTSLRNVMRSDDNPQRGGEYTEVLLAAAPVRVGDRVAVKQVVSRKNKNA
jgi:aspartyl-tRNA(Asn)/glutamyl-tRNA(Gln) amidotransferase subunit C